MGCIKALSWTSISRCFWRSTSGPFWSTSSFISGFLISTHTNTPLPPAHIRLLRQYKSCLASYLHLTTHCMRIKLYLCHHPSFLSLRLDCACHTFHYMKRLIETIFVHRFSHGTMPLRTIVRVRTHYHWTCIYLFSPVTCHLLLDSDFSSCKRTQCLGEDQRLFFLLCLSHTEKLSKK